MKRLLIIGSIIVLGGTTIAGCTKETEIIQRETILQEGISSKDSEVKDTSITQEETIGKPETERESQNTTKAAVEKETETIKQTQGASYTVIGVSYQEGGVNIHYPQIQGLADTEVESEWNDIIKNDIFTDIDTLGENNTYNCDFEIGTQIEDMLSIVVSGDAYAQGAAHPYNFMKTYNIDLNSGEAIKLTDIADVEQIAADIIEGKGYDSLGIDKQDFDANIQAWNYSIDSLASQLQSGYFYQKEGKIILIIGVSHAAGDYAKIELH